MAASGDSENIFTSILSTQAINASKGNPYNAFNVSQLPASNGTHTNFYKTDLAVLSSYLNTYVSGPICIFGILGNFLTLAVLTRRSLFKSMNIMERSSHIGLTALSLSDMMYCITFLPSAFLKSEKSNPFYPFHFEIDFNLVYETYQNGVINIFITCSTFLIVVMAAQRYLAICHPLKARQVIELKYTRVIVIGTVIFSILLNLPRFWKYQIIAGSCTELRDDLYCSVGPIVYVQMGHVITLNKVAKNVYMSFFFIISIAIPLLVLMFCNFNLIKTLHGSLRIRRQLSNSHQLRSLESTHRITLTLEIIVVGYIVLVVPAEIHNFVWEFISDSHSQKLANQQNFTAALLGVLQNINFSFNFILYCIINTNFRKTIVNLLFCAASSPSESLKSSSKSYCRTQSVDEMNLKPISDNTHHRNDVIDARESKHLIMVNGHNKPGQLVASIWSENELL